MFIFWLPFGFVLGALRLAGHMKHRWPRQGIDWVHDSYWGYRPEFVKRAPLPPARVVRYGRYRTAMQ